MAISIRITGKKEQYVTRRFDVTKATVSCVNPTNGKFYEKSVTIDGKVENMADMLSLLFIEKDKYLAIREKDENGNVQAFIAMPVQIVSMEYAKEAYKISADVFRKHGIRITEKEADEIEANS